MRDGSGAVLERWIRTRTKRERWKQPDYAMSTHVFSTE
jgi:hypothetical protein